MLGDPQVDGIEAADGARDRDVHVADGVLALAFEGRQRVPFDARRLSPGDTGEGVTQRFGA